MCKFNMSITAIIFGKTTMAQEHTYIHLLRTKYWYTYDVITFLICIIQKLEFLQNEKRYAKKETAILLYSEKPLK